MQDDVRKDFLPLTSETRWFMTWITRTFGGLLLLVAFLLVLGLPVMMSDKLAIFSIVAMVYYPVLAFGLYRFFRYQKRLRKKVIRKIRVDNQGIHYERADGTIDQILYHDLEKYSLPDVYDVSFSPRNKMYVLNVKHKGFSADVDFDGTDAGYCYYFGNLKALRRRYIQGIVRFRPDLRINPMIYEVYYIYPADFTFDKKKYRTEFALTFAVMMIGCIVLGVIMLGLVKWIF